MAQRKGEYCMLDKENRFMLSFTPLPLIVHAFEVDFDVKLKDQLWLSIAPQYNKRKDSLNGFGLSINVRYYDPQFKGLYYGVGAFFDYNHVVDISNNNRQNPKNPICYDVQSKRIGAQIIIGGLFQIFPRTTLDIFGGFGFRQGFYKFAEGSEIIEMRNLKFSSYLKQGFNVQLGIRLGFLL
ncbi:MAG: hypothetical protein RR256_03190 [Bacteroidales bacterium]